MSGELRSIIVMDDQGSLHTKRKRTTQDNDQDSIFQAQVALTNANSFPQPRTVNVKGKKGIVSLKKSPGNGFE